MSTVKRIEIEDAMWQDERGWGTNPFKAFNISDTAFLDLHVVSLKPGHIRGNHYHADVTEWMLICGGAVRFLWKAVEEKRVHEVMIRDEEPALLEIPPLVEHAVKNEGEHEIYLIVMNSCSEPDMIRCSSLFELETARF
jgi:dTDP-4-dehydrorhamnose 3,5-epimerase-like enzyme